MIVATSQTLRFPPDPGVLACVRRTVDSVFAGHRVEIDEVERGLVHLLVTEAAANVIEHGGAEASIVMHVSVLRETLEVRFVHDGAPFEPASVPDRPLDRIEEGGLGLPLITTLADDIQYRTNDQGLQEVVVVKGGLRRTRCA